MFYVKKKLKGVEITIDIDYDNVFTKCPVCGRESVADLNEIAETGGDIYTTTTYCTECYRREHRGKR